MMTTPAARWFAQNFTGAPTDTKSMLDACWQAATLAEPREVAISGGYAFVLIKSVGTKGFRYSTFPLRITRLWLAIIIQG